MSSYMPYCVDLELVGKSPYSATANDALHNWVHILGSLSGLERSKKAAVVGSTALSLVLAAATAAYRMGKSTVLKQTFLRGNEKRMVDLGLLGKSQVRTMNLFKWALLEKSAKGWVAWSQSDGAREIVSEYFALQSRHFKKERAKSIEALLANYNILELHCF